MIDKDLDRLADILSTKLGFRITFLKNFFKKLLLASANNKDTIKQDD